MMSAARRLFVRRRPEASFAFIGGATAGRGSISATGSELSQFPVPVVADPSGRSPVGRVIASLFSVVLLTAVPVSPALARQAAPTPTQTPAPTIGERPPQNLCIQVEVGGERVGHLECASEALQAAARVARDEARAPLEAPTPGVGSPDASVGVSTVSGARLRLGPALGTSVHRPGQGPATPAPGVRP